VLTDFAKEFEKPKVKVGLVEGKPVTQAQVKALAALPSKTQLLAQLGEHFRRHGWIPGSTERTSLFNGGCPRGAKN